MGVLHARGRRVPQDVKIVGVGHSRISGLVRPCLTTAHYFYEKSGEEAARILLEIIQCGVDMHQQIKLGYEIVRRQKIYITRRQTLGEIPGYLPPRFRIFYKN